MCEELRGCGCGGGFLIAILQAYYLVYKLLPFEFLLSCHYLIQRCLEMFIPLP